MKETLPSQSPLLEELILNLGECHGCRAFLVIVRRVVDPRADGKAPHQPGIAGRPAKLSRPLQPPFYNAPCANPIQFLAKRTDPLTAVVEFVELRRC